MRLLNTSTLALEEYYGSQTPIYAILSHTWSAEELTYQDVVHLDSTVQSKLGFLKVRRMCDFVKTRGFKYAWIDTCCIDKRSSAELTEAINSMFKWYQQAEICIVHLDDFAMSDGSGAGFVEEDWVNSLKGCRWFTRGWTLQELIASRNRLFVTNDWRTLDFNYTEVCSKITNVDSTVLDHTRRATQVCVAERMSWAAARETTRDEDRAYSLMGLFQVSMPILYGEGMHNAFRRLQEEIMKRSFDQTIFAWHGPYESSGLLARSPSDFKDTPNLSIWAPDALTPYSMTNAGILIRPCLFDVQHSEENVEIVSAILQCDVELEGSWGVFVISLQRISEAYCWVNGKKCEAFRRIQCSRQIPLRVASVAEQSEFAEILVLEDEHFELVQQSVKDNERKWQSELLRRSRSRDLVCHNSATRNACIQLLHGAPGTTVNFGKSNNEVTAIEYLSHGYHSTCIQMLHGVPGTMVNFRALEPVAGRVLRKLLKDPEENQSSTAKDQTERENIYPVHGYSSSQEFILCDAGGGTVDIITRDRLKQRSLPLLDMNDDRSRHRPGTSSRIFGYDVEKRPLRSRRG